MNEIFLIGKVLEEVEYNFIIEKGKNAKAILKLELLDKTRLELIAYDDVADFCFRELIKNDMVSINGKITNENVEIYNIEKFLL